MVGDLAVATRLRGRWPASLVALATEQAELRGRAAAKFSRAASMLFTRDGLEQASSEPLATHRATRLAAALPDRSRTLDLCCGVGGDSLALAGAGLSVVAVDRDEVHARLAGWNAEVYGASLSPVVADVMRWPVDATDVVYVDPARRGQLGSTTHRGGYQPPLEWCLSLPAERVVIKAAPGTAHELIPPGWEAEWVALGRELKECVLWSPGFAAGSRRATVVPAAGGAAPISLLADPAAAQPPMELPGEWIIDPSPAITRAGAVADLAAIVGGWQVDRRIGFLCTALRVDTSWGRTLRVRASLPWSVRNVKRVLADLDAGDVQLRRRGLAGDVEQIRRRLAGNGRLRATVLMTRVADRPWALVCTDPDGDAVAASSERLGSGSDD